MANKHNFLWDFFKIIRNERGSAGFMGGEGGEGDGGSGNSGDGDPGSQGSGGDANSNNTPKVSYPSDLDETYHGNPTLLKYVDKEGQFRQGEVMKALIHASSQIGKEKMLVPNKDFTDDQWGDTYKKLGLPESVDKYDLKNNVPEGMQADEEFFGKFREEAFKNGVLPRQAQALADMYNNHVTEQSKTHADAAQMQLDANVNALKEEWGQDYQRKVGIADSALKEFASKEDIEKLGKSGIFDNPEVTKLFAKIGESLGDDTFIEGGNNQHGKGTAEIQAEIDSYYDKKHPFRIPTHPQNKFYRNKMMSMLEQLHGTKPV